MARKTEIEKFLKGVEMKGELPIILSRWGFKKVKMEGKTYLMAMTEVELKRAKSKPEETIRDISAFGPKRGWCVTNGYVTCVPAGGCRGCVGNASGTNYYCDCTS